MNSSDRIYAEYEKLYAKCEELKEKYKWYEHYKESALSNKEYCNRKIDEINRYKDFIKELQKYITNTSIVLGIDDKSTLCGSGSLEYWGLLTSTIDNKINDYKQALDEIEKLTTENLEKYYNHCKYAKGCVNTCGINSEVNLKQILYIINKAKEVNNAG